MVLVVIGFQELKQASWINDAWTARSVARVTQETAKKWKCTRKEGGKKKKKEKVQLFRSGGRLRRGR